MSLVTVSDSRVAVEGHARHLHLARTYAWCAVLAAIAMLYGSLVPLTFQRVPLADALTAFRGLRLTGISLSSDGVANVLLAMPLAFCATGAVGLGRRGWGATLITALFVCTVLPLFSLAIEFLQIFVPGRTPSLNDVAAQVIGGLAGVTLRWSFAGAADDWLRVVAARSRATRGMRLLAIYVPALLLIDLLPFDITISPGDLWHKYREGRIVLVPFSMHYESVLAALWDFAGVVMKAAPLGALLMLDQPRTRRSALRALVLGSAVMSGLELAQVFILSRYADMTDVILGWVGVAAGVFLAAWKLPQALEEEASPKAINWSAAAAAGCWVIVLVAFEWYPFEVNRDLALIRANLSKFLEVPFAGYYMSDPLSALGDAVTKVLMAIPLGVFTNLTFGTSPSGSRRVWISTLFFLVIFCCIELGQAFIAGRYASITDALLLTAAAAAGCVIAATGRGIRRANRPLPSTAHEAG